jgi:hypothetical protein
MQTDALHIKATQAFINENPEDIILTRRAKVTQPSGGFRWDAGAPLPAQVMRKVAINRVTAAVQRVTEDGRTVFPTAALVALPSADIQSGDLFILAGVPHEVVFVSDRPKWRLQAEVIEHVS